MLARWRCVAVDHLISRRHRGWYKVSAIALVDPYIGVMAIGTRKERRHFLPSRERRRVSMPRFLMKPGLYWSYATRSLIRGGQRTILAIFCVVVGVMAIVALQLVGLSVNQALIGNIVEANGGDIRLNAEIAPLRQPDLAFFDKLKQQG